MLVRSILSKEKQEKLFWSRSEDRKQRKKKVFYGYVTCIFHFYFHCYSTLGRPSLHSNYLAWDLSKSASLYTLSSRFGCNRNNHPDKLRMRIFSSLAQLRASFSSKFIIYFRPKTSQLKDIFFNESGNN